MKNEHYPTQARRYSRKNTVLKEEEFRENIRTLNYEFVHRYNFSKQLSQKNFKAAPEKRMFKINANKSVRKYGYVPKYEKRNNLSYIKS